MLNLRNVLALLAGIVIGGGVDTALIVLSPSLIPPPAGVDVSSAEGLSKAMHLSSRGISQCRSWRTQLVLSLARGSWTIA